MDVQESLRTILAIMANVFEAHTVALFLRDGGRGGLRLRAWFSMGDAVDPAAALGGSGGGTLAGWIAQNGRPLLANGFDRTRGALGYYRPGEEPDLRAFMGCPVGQGLGVLCVDTRRGAPLGERDQKALAQFAALAAQLAAGHGRDGNRAASCYQALGGLILLRESTVRWSPYMEGFLTQLAQGAGMDHAFLAVLDRGGLHYAIEGQHPRGLLEGDALGPHSAGVGLAGWVLRSHQPLYHSQDYGGDGGARSSGPLFGPAAGLPAYRRLACVPVAFSGRTRAALALGGLETDAAAPLDEEFKSFLRLAASNLALFLENLLLRNRLTGG